VELAKALGVDPYWLSTGQGGKDVHNPIVSTVILKPESNAEWMGGFELWDNETPLRDDEVALHFFREVELSGGAGRHHVQENHGRKLRFAKSTLKDRGVSIGSAACVTVSGDSMSPVLPNGSTVGIDTSDILESAFKLTASLQAKAIS